MASLGTFARRMRRFFAPRVVDRADEAVRRVAVATSQAVILATPVDTGRARGNWQAEVGRDITGEIERLDPSGSEAVASNNRRIDSYRGQGSVYISNNLPYIGRLNEGHSAQAPAGFVELAVATGVAAARRSRIL